ncbi:thymidylate kinase [Eggerthella guodeyinii]|uniref:Thymidylate kinase n=1 Tax=Eggerthella guodeyinii TaxID=2690837 RepID=A0A6L7IRT4_9ACTN|nr:thymidylate kinase [Eggerthella guodeyinii]QOS67612.1 thymidylate kinase [Eggerthella guodeyinii]
MARGRLVVVEGLDGSGKETQTNLLRASLIERGIDLRSLSFPRYGSASSALVRMYLSGQFGSNPDDVGAYAASTFYAVDRYASYKSDWKGFYEAGGMVLADRYTTSNAVHQCAKLPREEWDGFLDWLFDFEYDLLGIPEPDLVIYLSMDSAASRRLVEERCAREGVAKDIHEADGAYLDRCREAADHCALRCGWKRVECAPEGKLRSIEDIHEEVSRLMEKECFGEHRKLEQH